MRGNCEPDQDLPMADLIERLIMQRRSIRDYTDEPVPGEWIEAVLRCGAQAPSPSNRQPVRFVRLASPALRERLHRGLLEGYARLSTRNQEAGGSAGMRNRIKVYFRYSEFMLKAPVLMAVGVSSADSGFGGRLADAGLMDGDPRQGVDADITVGLALKGMLLKAQSLGLGSCILTAPLVFFGPERLENLLGMSDFQVRCLLTLGFAAESPPPVPRLPLRSVYKVL